MDMEMGRKDRTMTKKFCLAFCLLLALALSGYGEPFQSYGELIAEYPNSYGAMTNLSREQQQELLNLAANLFLDFVKEAYWNNYPEEEGYKNTGDAFEKYFSKPKWKASWSYNGTPHCTLKVIFSGIGKYNGKNAMFNAVFSGWYGRSDIQFEEATVNGVNISPGELLAEIYLN